MLNQPTLQKLHAMKLLAMAELWQQQQRDPDIGSLSFDERFAFLVDAEHLSRDNRRLARRLNEAQLRHRNACMEDVSEPQKRGLEVSILRKLATFDWVTHHLNVVITGATGVGKTYLACALGQGACRTGFRVLYRRVPRLIDELTLARADGSLSRLFARLARMDILILDDWGLAPLADQQRRDLLEVVEDRDGARSTIITSQIPVDHWHDFLGDPTVADAIADRLLHCAHRISLKGPSRRKDRSQP
jgi:DNA replication protein DnaC